MRDDLDHRLTDLSLSALTKAIAAKTPAPGGGAAAAAAAAQGAALLHMVGAYSASQAPAELEPSPAEALQAQAHRCAQEFLTLLEADAKAYTAVAAALSRSKEDPRRPQAIRTACARACQPPARLAEEASGLLAAAARFAPFVNKGLACDLAIAADLLLAACRGGELLVRVNAASAGDEGADLLRQAADNLTSAQEAHTAILGTLQLRD